MNEEIPLIRLNKFISQTGICARREADRLIQAGHITVDGAIVRTVGRKIPPHATVIYRGQQLYREVFTYILLNKPRGYLTTLRDPQGRNTVLDLIDKKHCTERIYPVGRLDYHTTGLLLLTNDGRLAQRLAHPANRIEKRYHVTLDRPIALKDIDTIDKGLTLSDGFVAVDCITAVATDLRQVTVVIHVGKNRIVRRIFKQMGYSVRALDRIGYAHLTPKNLPRGAWTFLNEKEIDKLRG